MCSLYLYTCNLIVLLVTAPKSNNKAWADSPVGYPRKSLGTDVSFVF